jgi:hypothetical protein
MAPVLARAPWRDAGAMFARWHSWLAAALLAGPLFGMPMFTALQWVPDAHAALLPVTAMSVMGTTLSDKIRCQILSFAPMENQNSGPATQ